MEDRLPYRQKFSVRKIWKTKASLKLSYTSIFLLGMKQKLDHDFQIIWFYPINFLRKMIKQKVMVSTQVFLSTRQSQPVTANLLSYLILCFLPQYWCTSLDWCFTASSPSACSCWASNTQHIFRIGYWHVLTRCSFRVNSQLSNLTHPAMTRQLI